MAEECEYKNTCLIYDKNNPLCNKRKPTNCTSYCFFNHHILNIKKIRRGRAY